MNGGTKGAFPFDDADRWPEQRTRRAQLRKIKRILRLAQRELPFYRRLYQGAGLEPDSVENFRDFHKVPSIAKRDVLAAAEAAGGFDFSMEAGARGAPAVVCMTSGTLATSFLYLTSRWVRRRGDSLARAYWWGGLRPGMRMLMAAPAWHGLAVQESHIIQRMGVTCVVPQGTILPRFAGPYLDCLLDLRPDFVAIFLPLLFAVVAECKRRGVAAREAFASVANILVVGAPMTPLSRLRLTEELAVEDIYEGAGNPEGLTAMECSHHTGHHIFMDVCHVEVVDPRTGLPVPPGTRGNIVLTTLIPHGTVFIRYDTEDIGEILPDPCGCGRSWPLLEIYDRRANVVRVAGKDVLAYDVRLCLDEVPELIGVPFAIVRQSGPMERLRLIVQKPAGADVAGLATQLRARIGKRLALAASEEWSEQLPERWKGISVIDEAQLGGHRV